MPRTRKIIGNGYVFETDFSKGLGYGVFVEEKMISDRFFIWTRFVIYNVRMTRIAFHSISLVSHFIKENKMHHYISFELHVPDVLSSFSYRLSYTSHSFSCSSPPYHPRSMSHFVFYFSVSYFLHLLR